MRSNRLFGIALMSFLLVSTGFFPTNAKENTKVPTKEKSQENKQAIKQESKQESQQDKGRENSQKSASTSATPTATSGNENKSSLGEKPGNSSSAQASSSSMDQKPSSAEGKSDKSDVVSNKSKLRGTEVVANFESSPSDSCKAAEKAKKKNPQNLCSDFIVVFKPQVARGNADKLLTDSGAQKVREFTKVFNGALVNGPLAKMQALAKNPNVLVVEDDLEVTTTVIQSPAPWGLDRIDQAALPLNQAFDDRDESGANAYAYVIDTGIDNTNIDFEGRIAAGFTAVLDGRGSLDCNGHGTHVAGTIGGKTYGVAKKITVVPVRVLDCAGSGSYSSVISGLDWIAANHPAGVPAVVNMSLGGPASSTLDGAIKNLIAKGISVVVAAGNSAADACNYSPARVTEAITVAATSILDVRAAYSNFGSCVDVFAPGSEITSTWLGASSTNTISGTSMATPHVAGAVARFISANPALTPGQVANSVSTSAINGVVISSGTNSPNKFLSIYINPDTTSVVPVDSSPTFKKVIPRGKKR